MPAAAAGGSNGGGSDGGGGGGRLNLLTPHHQVPYPRGHVEWSEPHAANWAA